MTASPGISRLKESSRMVDVVSLMCNHLIVFDDNDQRSALVPGPDQSHSTVYRSIVALLLAWQRAIGSGQDQTPWAKAQAGQAQHRGWNIYGTNYLNAAIPSAVPVGQERHWAGPIDLPNEGIRPMQCLGSCVFDRRSSTGGLTLLVDATTNHGLQLDGTRWLERGCWLVVLEPFNPACTALKVRWVERLSRRAFKASHRLSTISLPTQSWFPPSAYW